eukprot:gnl/Dysnectes_brevis/2969_a3656_954.p1 GENE.gnl/Dysnectes_brevis/2969_a3656_954~~gnl/Dysnectes_brevis/2969_a3656_954.p1  ORF type:complete len:304 (-),score=24.72 gnl/Dysnectes_brevis/2969_a3656_954:24-866(-)
MPPGEFEKAYVHEVYDVIASNFSHTRYNPWPAVANFLKTLPVGSTLLDCGCGNGKYFSVNPSLVITGIDFSVELAAIAAEKHPHTSVLHANILKLPFKSNSFDAIISIAVIHHLSTPERRLDAFKEIERVLKPGGRALITVWAHGQKSRSLPLSTTPDSLVPWKLQDHWRQPAVVSKIEALTQTPTIELKNMAKRRRRGQRRGEGEVKERLGGQKLVVLKRYYHFFQPGELAGLAMDAGLVIDVEASRSTLASDQRTETEAFEQCSKDNYFAVLVKDSIH